MKTPINSLIPAIGRLFRERLLPNRPRWDIRQRAKPGQVVAGPRIRALTIGDQQTSHSARYNPPGHFAGGPGFRQNRTLILGFWEAVSTVSAPIPLLPES
jgi:hypothetical protein